MNKNTTKPRHLQQSGLMAVMLFITCGLLVTTVPAESSDDGIDHSIMSRARAKRIMDHGDGSVLRLIILNEQARAPKEEHIPVFNSPLRMDLILPIRIVEVETKKPRTFKVRTSSRWRSNAFQKWQKKRKR
jgi:hypothetical protein